MPTTWEQKSYFGWLGWVLLAALVAVGVAYVVTRQRPLAIAIAVLGVLGLILTTFALRGDLTWAQYWDEHANLRFGGYLAFLGYLVAGSPVTSSPAAPIRSWVGGQTRAPRDAVGGSACGALEVTLREPQGGVLHHRSR